MRQVLFILIAFSISNPLAFSQTNSHAAKYFNEAMMYQSKKMYADARSTMEKAIQENPSYTDAQSILAEWYFSDHQFAKAKNILVNAYRFNKLFAYPYAKSLVYTYQPTAALEIINANIATGRKEWKLLQQQAFFIQKAMIHPHTDTIYNLGRPNTPDPEMHPWITDDSSKIYFTRRISNIDQDFFFTSIDSCGGWFTGINLGNPPNTADQENAQMISADGHYLFYTKCENRSINGWELGGCDLYMSYRVYKDSPWSAPQGFGATINTTAYEGMGCLSADNKMLYFVSDRKGGFGGYDIWMSKFENGLWQIPKNLGSNINTSEDETAPYLYIDNQTLYFSSTGHPGMGGSDFFMSTKINDTTWQKAINLGYPINTSADEQSMNITASGKTLFFSSDRDSMAGNFDIYYMNLPKKLQPIPIAIVKGYVRDSFEKKKLNYARVTIQDVSSGAEVYNFLSNKGDGSYLVTLPIGKKYYVNTGRFSYKDRDDTLDLTYAVANDIYLHNLSMIPYDYVAPIKDTLILTITFPKNNTELSDIDKQVLTLAMAPWLDDIDNTTFYINSYTDNIGSPIVNEQLSSIRANTVAKEIMMMGANASNVHPEGWGDADPIYPNDTEEYRQYNRRVEIIIRR